MLLIESILAIYNGFVLQKTTTL